MMTNQGTDGPTDRKWRYPDRSEHPDVEIFVYDKWCKACGICYELCPAGVLEADKAGCPVVAHPEKCLACNLCEMLCPDMAITVYKERKKAAGKAEGEGGGSAAKTDDGGAEGSDSKKGGETRP